MRFINYLLSNQKGGYANPCEITIRIALTYLLKKNNEQNFDPTYLAAQIYFAVLFNDNTLIDILDNETNTINKISVKDHLLKILNSWLKLSSQKILVRQTQSKEVRDKFYLKTPNDKELKNISEMNRLITTNEFNFINKKLENFNLYKDFFMITKLTEEQKNKLIELSNNDDKNCIDIILSELKELFSKLESVETYNNYNDTILSDALKLLEKKILEMSFGDKYNNEFLKKLRVNYIYNKKFPTPDVTIYKNINCTLNKLYYLRAVQKFYNIMEIINYNYQENYFNLKLSKDKSSTLYTFTTNCGLQNFEINLETSLDGLNTKQILERIKSIENQLSIFNKSCFNIQKEIDQLKLNENIKKLKKIFNKINETLSSVSITPQQIIELKKDAEFHKYNRENVKIINFLQTFNLDNITIDLDPIPTTNVLNNDIISIEREDPQKDLKEYLCKINKVDNTLNINETTENIQIKQDLIKNKLKNIIIEEEKQENKKEKVKSEETIGNQENSSVKDKAKLFEKLGDKNKKYKYLKYKSKYLQLKSKYNL